MIKVEEEVNVKYTKLLHFTDIKMFPRSKVKIKIK